MYRKIAVFLLFALIACLPGVVRAQTSGSSVRYSPANVVVIDGTVAANNLSGTNTGDKPGMKSFVIPIPTGADDALVQIYFASAVTITRVVCSTDTGTATLQLDERAEATPNAGGVDVLTAPIVCDTNSEITTSFANATIAARVPLSVDVDAVASTPGVVRMHIEFTID